MREVTVSNLPTGVGMYRGTLDFKMLELKSPHRRGDVPCPPLKSTTDGEISPQAWGCTAQKLTTRPLRQNLPTGVGMYRNRSWSSSITEESPHRRGDVPYNKRRIDETEPISPQAWGCTEFHQRHSLTSANLPTGVGMYQTVYRKHPHWAESPHRRGDVPMIPGIWAVVGSISPQAWGCTEDLDKEIPTFSNLPTGVGMYRTRQVELANTV